MRGVLAPSTGSWGQRGTRLIFIYSVVRVGHDSINRLKTEK